MKKILLAVIVSLFLAGSTNAAEFNTNLKFGSKGADVVKLQEFLAEQNLYSGPITGNFFSLTLKAVKALQTREAISPVSGFFGNLTRAKVNEILDSQLVESESESVNEPVDTGSPVSAEVLRLNEILGAVQAQNTLLQNSLNLQQSETDRLKAIAKIEADRIKAINDANEAFRIRTGGQTDQEAAEAMVLREQAAQAAAQQAAKEASRPFTQQEMAEKARQILVVKLTEATDDEYLTSSISFNWTDGRNAYNPTENNTRVVFYGQTILDKNGPTYSAFTFENNQILPFLPPAVLHIYPPYDDSMIPGLVPVPNRPDYFYRPLNLYASRPCNGYCGSTRIGNLYFKPEGWKYQIIFSYPGRQESTYEGTFNIPAI